MSNYFGHNYFGGGYWANNLFAGPNAQSIPESENSETNLDVLEGILGRRSRYSFPGFSHNFIELFHGKPVELLIFEPDPNTYRDGFYYNSRENRLFKKMRAGNLLVWKDVSES